MVSNLATSIVFFIVAISVLVTFHEYGHAWMARRMGVIVIRFSIGFGPEIWKFKPKKSLTEYVISSIPLGGYVQMVDEKLMEKIPESLLPHAFNRQPLYKRSAIVAAGPLANFLLAALLYTIVAIIGTEDYRPVVGQVANNGIAKEAGFQVDDEIISVDGRPNRTWSENHLYIYERLLERETVIFEIKNDVDTQKLILDFSQLSNDDIENKSFNEMLGIAPRLPEIRPLIGKVIKDKPADIAGLKRGDEVTHFNGSLVNSWSQLVRQINSTEMSSVAIRYMRDGVSGEVIVTPETIDDSGQTIRRIGVMVNVEEQLQDSYSMTVLRQGPVDAVIYGFTKTWDITVMTVKFLARMLVGGYGTESISGPITIADYAGKAAKAGLSHFIEFLAILSISLGILNLLPIPVLDGGHLLFHVYELVTGRKPTDQLLMRANQLGIVLLIGLMGLAFYNDFARIF